MSGIKSVEEDYLKFIVKTNIEFLPYNLNTYKSFFKKNKEGSKYFTFVFPFRFNFRFECFNNLLFQFQAFLKDLKKPFSTYINIEEYYENLFNLTYKKSIVFDLSKTLFIGELEILMLHILGKFCYKITQKKIIVKLSMDTLLFLRNWNFFKHFHEWGVLEEDYSQNLSPLVFKSNVLLRIRKITNRSDLGAALTKILVRTIQDILMNEYGMHKGDIKKFASDVVSELCTNIYRHSKSEGFIMVHARDRNSYVKDPNIEISIVDGGIGIRQSLLNKFPDIYKNKQHFTVIQEVLSGRFPENAYPKNETHGGIKIARKYVDKFNGLIFIRSICSKAGNQTYPLDFDKPWRFLPGTHINILIPRKKDYNPS